MGDRIRVQIVENNPLDEAGMRSLIGGHEEFLLVEHAQCVPGCKQNCASQLPDVMVLELTPHGIKNIDCIRQIHARQPVTHILAVCPQGDSLWCKMAMDFGAIGFISKQAPPTMFIDAIRQVARGKPFVEPWVAKRMIEARSKGELSPFDRLSSREYSILQLMLAGEDNKAIADQLHISISTLANHRSHIKGKLGISTVVELTRLAMRHGLIEGAIILFQLQDLLATIEIPM